MAVLAKIRQRSALLIAAIAIALFAFIIQDLIGKGGLGQNTKDVGSINGKDISFEDFRIKVSNVEKSGEGITSTAAANRVWDQEVSIALLTSEFDKLGLRVGEKHILEVLKADQNIGKNPLFLNAAGMFDIAKFKEYFKSNPAQAQYLRDREKDAELNAKFQIYNTLIKAAVYTTESEGKFKYEMEANKVNFAYVAGLYSTIKDSDVKVTDAEIVDFMKKNEKKYKADESREVEYVLIEDKASTEDENEVKSKINGLLSGSVVYNQATGKNDTLPGFKSAANTIEFVNSNSDVPYDSTYIAKKDLPAVDADRLFNLAPGEVYGPYMFGKYYCISKSMGKKLGVNAKASHILISYEGTQVPNQKEKRNKEQAKAKAEAILAQVNANPDSFLMLAFTNSDDSSAQQGGDLGYFGPNQMVKPFNDFVFNNSIGNVGLVETPFGFHIIKITDKQDGIRLATVAQKIEASEVTSDKIFTQATKFEMDAADTDFAKVAKNMKLTIAAPVTVKAMDETFGPLGNQRTIVRWAFEDDSKVGAVKRFEVANLGHVIAKVKSIDKSGLVSITLARPYVEPILKNKKKAELIKAKMTGTSLEAIAKATGSTVQQATEVTMENPMLVGAGQEPKVVGNAFALSANKLSAPIEGNTGVYVVKNVSTVKAPALKSHEAYVAKLKSQSASDVNRVIPALKGNAKIEDNRKQFNY
ncbi:peptidylprolyl isomerase [Flavobacterium gawalongense]|uniref:Periplasmic chaperone PpiD n=1 Tax=Flavobacterium gawalongense TaxID=2594432 RepID=A0A553BUA2_9FLAO|nr:peptidylprolyl isomerase [Flavobacterium gawalongense]TRX02470.1 peptidylprolyl isomerase [Flavobacterium gawalongense]TRX07702.1 peptidylprolyl isomerase [Flavobacterium gawalongense]TRX11831.1 peptidylprolyl isomerase [Flavobacterium gawalongense]TRX13011.1 peptidylprolyl isomerase [Flavobacterium gawalongense]TRX31021.1 peptidylprolyl isomerase [Flavobacterium gawalongense]